MPRAGAGLTYDSASESALLIAGGGIGGLALVRALGLHGIRCRVLERRPARATEGAGIGLGGPPLRLLARLGVRLAPVRAFTEVESIELRSSKGTSIRSVDLRRLRELTGYPTVAIGRHVLREALLEGVPSGSIEFGQPVESVRSAGGLVEVRTAGGGSWTGSALVGADGSFSTIRRHVRPDLPGPGYAGYTAWQGLAPIESPRPGVSVLALGPGAEFGFAGAGRSMTYWYASRLRSRSRSSGNDPKAGIRSAFGAWSVPVHELIDATPQAAIVETPIFTLRPFRGWARGRVALMGDAAHPLTPHLGQGAALAIGDAWVLATELARGGTVPEAFRRYEAVRRPLASRVVRDSARLGRMFHWRGRWAVRARDAAVRWYPESWLQNRFRALFGGAPSSEPSTAAFPGTPDELGPSG